MQVFERLAEANRQAVGDAVGYRNDRVLKVGNPR